MAHAVLPQEQRGYRPFGEREKIQESRQADTHGTRQANPFYGAREASDHDSPEIRRVEAER